MCKQGVSCILIPVTSQNERFKPEGGLRVADEGEMAALRRTRGPGGLCGSFRAQSTRKEDKRRAEFEMSGHFSNEPISLIKMQQKWGAAADRDMLLLRAYLRIFFA
jgi:hypothetical protein